MHLGGQAEPVRLTKEYKDAAVRAAQVIGLRVAGVDLLESDAGPLIMEVNSSPGLEGIEAATGKDIAGAVTLLAHKGTVAAFNTYGSQSLDAGSVPMSAETIFRI